MIVETSVFQFRVVFRAVQDSFTTVFAVVQNLPSLCVRGLVIPIYDFAFVLFIHLVVCLITVKRVTSASGF